MRCAPSTWLHFKDLELILWVQIKLYGPPCLSTAATAWHICCSGIWSLSASWSETTSMPAAIYHRDKDRVCMCVCVWRWDREKVRVRERERVRLCIGICDEGLIGRGEDATMPAPAGGFGDIFISSSHKVAPRAPHTMAPSKCPNSLATNTQALFGGAKSQAANLIILCRCVSCSRNGNRCSARVRDENQVSACDSEWEGEARPWETAMSGLPDWTSSTLTCTAFCVGLFCSEGDTVLANDVTISSPTCPKQGVLLCAIFLVLRWEEPGGNKSKIVVWWVTRVDELLSETLLPFYIQFKITDV